MKAYQVWSIVPYEAGGGNGDFICSRDTLEEARVAAQREVDNPNGPTVHVWITTYDAGTDTFTDLDVTFSTSEWIYRADPAHLSACATCRNDIPVGVPRLERGTRPYSMCPTCIQVLSYTDVVREALGLPYDD